MSEDILDLVIGSVDRLLREECGDAMWVQFDAGHWPAASWKAIEAIGLPSLMVSEASGGAGLTFGQASQVMRLAARHALPLPLAETVIAAWLLDRAGIAVPSGPLTFSDSDDVVLADETLSGIAKRVPWGRNCGSLVIISSGRIGLVDRAHAAIVPGHNLAGEPRDLLTFANAPLSASAELASGEGVARRIGAAMRSVQIAGACTSCLALTIEYANLRTQFGKAIGKFQAVQHSLAVLAEEAAAAIAAADLGCDAIERDFDAFGVACAKTRASESAGRASALAHQVFGAIGFTLEHPLQRLTRRLWSWREEFGGEVRWAAELGRLSCAAGGSGLWPEIAAR